MARRSIHGLRTIVTGATSGIGRALAIELVRRGAKVVGMGRRRDRLQWLAEELRAAGRYCYVAGDVTQRDDRAAALEMAAREFGGLDALVNNAGIGALGPFDQADEAQLRRIMEVNFFAPAEFTRQALRSLIHGNRPIIVNVSSVLGHRAIPDMSEYCASKFALHGLSDSLRAELEPLGIDVLLVSPSTTKSEFFDVAKGESAKSPRRFSAMTAEAVARRAVRAMELGRHEIILSVGGNALVWLDRLCPPLADWLVAHWEKWS
jgi:short-subunit dehydrogenase